MHTALRRGFAFVEILFVALVIMIIIAAYGHFGGLDEETGTAQQALDRAQRVAAEANARHNDLQRDLDAFDRPDPGASSRVHELQRGMDLSSTASQSNGPSAHSINQRADRLNRVMEENRQDL